MESTILFSALIGRLRRRLAKDAVRLVKTRGGAANRWYSDLGEWHTVDSRNHSSGHIDPESLAREMGVLSSSEFVVLDECTDAPAGAA
jgi:hypothetical protein